MKKLKQFIDWFNGKKRSIGVIGLAALQLAVVKNNLSPEALEVLGLVFTAIGGLGIAHADLKSDKSIIKKGIDTAKKVKTFFWI